MLIKVYTGPLWIMERQIVPILERLCVSQAQTNFFSGGGMVMLSGAKWDFSGPQNSHLGNACQASLSSVRDLKLDI